MPGHNQDTTRTHVSIVVWGHAPLPPGKFEILGSSLTLLTLLLLTSDSILRSSVVGFSSIGSPNAVVKHVAVAVRTVTLGAFMSPCCMLRHSDLTELLYVVLRGNFYMGPSKFFLSQARVGLGVAMPLKAPLNITTHS